ncbi:hypothetical protein C8R43DRAFT_1112857 [Mycena crocata]|nr:hypothetical protein C8R43DRAFT_1112857 [Mycena crocata]
MPQFYLARGKSIHIVIAMPPLRGGGMVARRVQINTVRTQGLALVAGFWPPAAFFGKENRQNAVKNAAQTSNHYAGSRRRLKQTENCDALHWGSVLPSRGFSSRKKARLAQRIKSAYAYVFGEAEAQQCVIVANHRMTVPGWDFSSRQVVRELIMAGEVAFRVSAEQRRRVRGSTWHQLHKHPPTMNGELQATAASFHEMEHRNRTPGLSQAALSSALAIVFSTDQQTEYFPGLPAALIRRVLVYTHEESLYR